MMGIAPAWRKELRWSLWQLPPSSVHLTTEACCCPYPPTLISSKEAVLVGFVSTKNHRAEVKIPTQQLEEQISAHCVYVCADEGSHSSQPSGSSPAYLCPGPTPCSLCHSHCSQLLLSASRPHCQLEELRNSARKIDTGLK